MAMFRFIKIYIFCVIVSVMIFAVGCSEPQKQDVSKDKLEEKPAIQEATEQPVKEQGKQENTLEVPATDAVPPDDVSEETEPAAEQAGSEPSQEDAQDRIM